MSDDHPAIKPKTNPATVATQGDNSPAWSGDEHQLQKAAAGEAGLDADEVELELFTKAFRDTMVLDDKADRAIFLRGRTILSEKQFLKTFHPTMRFLSLGKDDIALRIHKGEFELRVARDAADRAAASLDSVKVALSVAIGGGLVGVMVRQISPILGGIVWALALLACGYTLRTGLVSGRAMLGARLVTSLGMLAQEEKLILPLGEGHAGKLPLESPVDTDESATDEADENENESAKSVL